MRSGKLFICLFVLMVAFMVRATAALAEDKPLIYMTVLTQGQVEIGFNGTESDPVTGNTKGLIPLESVVFKAERKYDPETGDIIDDINSVQISAIQVLKKFSSGGTADILKAATSNTTHEIKIDFYEKISESEYIWSASLFLAQARIAGVYMSTPINATGFNIPMELITITYNDIQWTSRHIGSGDETSGTYTWGQGP